MPTLPDNVVYLPNIADYPQIHLAPMGSFYGSYFNIPLQGKVFDFSKGIFTDGQLQDSSGNNLDMTPYSGWDISLDGIGDYIGVPASSAWDFSGDDYEITLVFRPDAFGATRCLITSGNPTTVGGWEVLQQSTGKLLIASTQAAVNSYHSAYTIPAPVVGEWNIYTFRWNNLQVLSATRNGVPVTVTTSVSPTGTYGDPGLGIRIGATHNGWWFYNGDIALVSIKDLSTGNYVAKWVPSAPSGTLTGLPVFDASGNGHHGTPVGCTGGNGEGIPAEVVGLGAYEDYMWFDGVNDSVSFGSTQTLTGDFDVTIEFYRRTATTDERCFFSGASDWIRLWSTFNRIDLTNGEGASYIDIDTYALDTFNTIRLVRVSGVISVYLNGDLQANTATNSGDYEFTRIGRRGVLDPFIGMFSFDLGQGTAWDGTETDAIAQGWTVSGSPVTIADKRRTIPQMFLQDWNRKDVGSYSYPFTSTSLWPETGGVSYTKHPSIFGAMIGYRSGSFVGYTPNVVPTNSYFYLEIKNLTTPVTIGFWNGSGFNTTGVYAPGDGKKLFNNVTSSGSFRLLTSGVPTVTLGPVHIYPASGVSDNIIYIPESPTPGIDALGNPIARPRGNLLNLTGVAGDYAEIADDASLDVTTAATWAMTGNFWDDEGGLTKLIYHRHNSSVSKRVWYFARIALHAAGDGKLRLLLSSDGTSLWAGDISGFLNQKQTLVVRYNGTTVEAFIDGSLSTITNTVGTVPDSLLTTDIGVRIGQTFDGANPSDQLIGHPVFYNRALSDDEVLAISSALQRKI